jgi:CubicO group peptidase (beta-lactamase class C family)
MISATQGVNLQRLSRLSDAITRDIDAEKSDGAVVLVARRGEIILHEAYGYADRSANRSMTTDSVFFTFSVLKQLSNVGLLQAIDRGDIAFTTLVSDIIPEYGSKGKEGTTIADLLLHRAGLPFGIPPLSPDQIGNLEAVTAAACNMIPECTPGTVIRYSAVIAHSVLGEIVRRLDRSGRKYSEIMRADVLEPLGMNDTSYGDRTDLRARRVPVVARDRTPGLFNPEELEGFGAIMTEGFEAPAGAALSTVADYFRFAEACRRGGELDGKRILSPAILKIATTDVTGKVPNGLWTYAKGMRSWRDVPSHFGLGFYLRGEGVFPTAFGMLASSRTFGGIGSGSNCFWVDPEKELSYVFFSSGLMEDSYSWERHQRLSDLVHSSLDD